MTSIVPDYARASLPTATRPGPSPQPFPCGGQAPAPPAPGPVLLARTDPSSLTADVIRRVMALPPTPPPGPAPQLPASLARWAGAGLAGIAGAFLTSEGPLRLAQALGQAPRWLTTRDVQDASRAMAAVGWTGEGMGQGWSPDQKGRFAAGAAELMRLHEGGRLPRPALESAMTDLLQVVGTRPAAAPAGPARPVPAPAPVPPPPPVPDPAAPPRLEPGKPSRIGGVTAARVPFSEAAREQAQAQARAFNEASPTGVALAYAVRDQRDGAWYVERIGPVTPSGARTLLWSLDQAGRLSGTRDANYLASGVGYRAPGGLVTPDQDLKDREAAIYFSRLTDAHALGVAQANALTINGRRGAVVAAEDYGTEAARAAAANGPERGRVDLAIPRVYAIPGPHGRTLPVAGVELFSDLTAAEARGLLNGAMGFADRDRDGTLEPHERDLREGTLGLPVDQVLADNGLSVAALDAVEAGPVEPPRASIVRPQPVPGVVPQTLPERVPQTVPAPIPQTVPGAIPQTVPGPIPQEVPVGPIPQTVPTVERAGALTRETAEAIVGTPPAAAPAAPGEAAGGAGGRQGPPHAAGPASPQEPDRADGPEPARPGPAVGRPLDAVGTGLDPAERALLDRYARIRPEALDVLARAGAGLPAGDRAEAARALVGGAGLRAVAGWLERGGRASGEVPPRPVIPTPTRPPDPDDLAALARFAAGLTLQEAESLPREAATAIGRHLRFGLHQEGAGGEGVPFRAGLERLGQADRLLAEIPSAEPPRGALPFMPFLDPNEIPAADQNFWRNFAAARPEEARAIAEATGGDHGALRTAVGLLRRGATSFVIVTELAAGRVTHGGAAAAAGPRQHFLGGDEPWRPGRTHLTRDGQSYILPDGQVGRIPFEVGRFYEATKAEELRTLAPIERYGRTLPPGLVEGGRVSLLDASLAQAVAAGRTPLDGRNPSALLSPDSFVATHGAGTPAFEAEWRRQVAGAIHDTHFAVGLPPSHHEQSGFGRWTIHAGEFDTLDPGDLARVYATELEAGLDRFLTTDIIQGRMPSVDALKRAGLLHHPDTRREVWAAIERYHAGSSPEARQEVLRDLRERIGEWIGEVADPARLREEAVFLNAYLDVTGLREARRQALDPSTGTPEQRIARLRDHLSGTALPTPRALEARMREIEPLLPEEPTRRALAEALAPVLDRWFPGERGPGPAR